jgi:hypothetical protein
MATIVHQNMISRHEGLYETCSRRSIWPAQGSDGTTDRALAAATQQRDDRNQAPTENKSHQRQSDCAHMAEFQHVTNHLAALFPLHALLSDWKRFLGLNPPITRDKAFGVSQSGPACSQLRNGLA